MFKFIHFDFMEKQIPQTRGQPYQQLRNFSLEVASRKRNARTHKIETD